MNNKLNNWAQSMLFRGMFLTYTRKVDNIIYLNIVMVFAWSIRKYIKKLTTFTNKK